MTLDEAIKHAEEVADICEYEANTYDINDPYERQVGEKEGKCASEHRQLAEWLKDYKRLLEQEPKWVPVSERLPKEFEFVNCTCHSLIDDREDWVIETVYIPLQNSPYSDWGNIPMLNNGDCEVVAWMHRDIPEPYKAESEGEE